MAKDTFYFSHDYNARNDEKILELRAEYGAEGYGIFWMVVEAMAEGSDGGLKASLIGGLSFGFGMAKDRLSELINYCVSIGLFYEKDGCYYSKRLLSHKDWRNSLSEKGKEGAKKRWGNEKKNSHPNSHPISTPNAKEKKGKDNKVNEIPIIDNSAAQKKELSNPESFPTWRQEVRDFLNDESFKKDFITRKKIGLSDLEERMNDFILKLNDKMDFKSTAALKVHFKNSYAKHVENGVNGGKSLSNGFIEVPADFDYNGENVVKW